MTKNINPLDLFVFCFLKVLLFKRFIKTYNLVSLSSRDGGGWFGVGCFLVLWPLRRFVSGLLGGESFTTGKGVVELCVTTLLEVKQSIKF